MLRGTLTPLLAVTLVVAACDDSTAPTAPAAEQRNATWVSFAKSCPADAPSYSLPEAARDSLPTPSGRYRTLNDEWADIAREVPGGWGGIFIEQDTLTMYLVEPSKREQAVDALGPLLRESGFERVAEDLPTARVKEGRWDFAQLHEWYRYVNRHVWNVEGVHSSDIVENRNRLEYGVADEEARQRVSELLDELDLPCYLVALFIQPPVQLT